MDNRSEKKIRFAEKLKEWRSIYGLRAGELAVKLNLAPTTVSTWERGKSYPDVLKLVELCDLLSVSLDEIIFGTSDNLLEGLTEMQKYIIIHTINEFKK